MKKRIFINISIIILGIVVCHLYFLFSAYISSYTVKLYKFTNYAPKSISIYVYWLYVLIQDSLFALPIFASGGFIMTFLIKQSPIYYGAIGFVGFTCAYVHYHFILYDIGFIGPLWFTLSKGMIFLLLFMCMSHLSLYLKKRQLKNMAC